MTHVDFNLGVYYPDGGVASVVDAVAETASELGVATELNTEVSSIDKVRDRRVVTANGSDYDADIVVSNTDYGHTEMDLLPPQCRHYGQSYWDSRTYAPSAFVLYLGVKGELDNLAHHTLVLPTDWDPHFTTIFDRPAWPEDPAYYVCVPSKTDPHVAPDGHSSLFILVPIAAGLDDAPEAKASYREKVLAELAAHTGDDVRGRIVFERMFCVSDFASRYNSAQGTALGLAHTVRQTAVFRPPHRAKRLPGLYYSGSYTTPGIGVPMSLISGDITARHVAEDFGA
jgi:phytoene desaturase